MYDDASGQVTKETTKLTKNKDVVKNYTYDSAGNKSAFTVKAGDDTKLSLTYDYDGESRLTSVIDDEGNEVVGYSYDTDGNLAERIVQGSSLTTTYTYDYQNHLTAMKNQTDSGVISEYKSEYLLNGQKSKEDSDTVDKDGKKSAKTATYTYDLLGRITKETKTGSEDISYTYDSNNNRKEMKAGNKVTAYKYNKNDELLRTDTLNTETEEDSVVIYKNDKNGNQLATVNRYEIPSNKKDSTYVDIDVTLGDNRLNENVVNHYNALNQLTQTLTKNYKVSFTYDAEGLRTSKTVNGEKTVFIWDGNQLVMELSDSGKVQKRYIRGNDLVYVDTGNNTDKQYYVTDSHGNVVQLIDESGKVTKTYEYDSFGNEVNPNGKDDNPFRYCGEYYDKETEEVYLRARYYQPVVGRFLTRDTYTGESDDPLSLHLYTYCGNDGVNQLDPTGHSSTLSYATETELAGMSKVLEDYISATSYHSGFIVIHMPVSKPKKISKWEKRIITVKKYKNRKNLKPKQKEFVVEIYNASLKIEKSMQIPAAISTAQACIESAYGTKVPKDIYSGKYSYNLFGVQEFGKNSYVTDWTHEYENGQMVEKTAQFRAYENYDESLKAHAKLLKKYKPSKNKIKNKKAWAESLKGYATDPNYSKKIMDVIKFLELE